ncbi:MAG: TonB-dependent receptor [Acidobacteria bacterium]|nr:TonB-dependent receptor [Acidobacteriota bacterium]
MNRFKAGSPLSAWRRPVIFGLVAAFGGPASAQEAQVGSLFERSLSELMDLRITSTARKREEPLGVVPVSVTAFSGEDMRDFGIRSFSDFAGLTPTLSFAYGNGFTVGNPSTGLSTSRSVAIRGLGGARTTGFYLDDTPLPSSIDVRITDLARIEVLKGPQGTLYGESSLGGSVRFITPPPDLERGSFRGMVEAGVTEQGGSLDRGVEGIGNLVLVPGKAALRLSVFGSESAGWISRSFPSNPGDPNSPRTEVDDQGAQRVFAGSITGLLRPTEAFTVSLRFMRQELHAAGFPASWAPLPGFEPVGKMARTQDVQPLADDTWTLPSVTMSYRGRGWTLTSATSYFDRRTRDEEDTSEGTDQIYAGAYPPQPFRWIGASSARQVAHETRVALDPKGPFCATFGAFYGRYETEYAILPMREASTNFLLWKENETNTQLDRALFGEFYYQLRPALTLTLGARQYWLSQDDVHTVLLGAIDDTIRGSSGSSGISPKVALSWNPEPTSLFYASASKGFRQGNAQLDPELLGGGPELAAHGKSGATFLKIRPDSLWSYEVGAKLLFPEASLQLTSSLFRIEVKDFQQQVLLKSIGLLLQGNAGGATITGGEVEVAGHPTPDLRFRLGLGYVSAHLTAPGNTFQAEGARIYHVPEWTASAAVAYTRSLTARTRGFLSLTGSYTGRSLSGNSGVDLERPAYTLVHLHTGISRARWELALGIENVTNARPNLGDLTYVGYGFYTDASRTFPRPQAATLPTRTWMLRFTTRF